MSYNDVFKEQLVKKKKTTKDTLKKAGIIVIGLLLIVFATPLVAKYGLTLPLVAIILWGEVILLRRFNVEYEYVLTNTDLDIDRIYNRLKRKAAISLDIRSTVVMIGLKNPNFKSEVGNVSKVYDYSSGVVTDETYAIVFERDGERNQLIFDPNETMFNAIKMYIPKKVK